MLMDADCYCRRCRCADGRACFGLLSVYRYPLSHNPYYHVHTSYLGIFIHFAPRISLRTNVLWLNDREIMFRPE